MNSQLDQLTTWLNSAYGMEENLAKVLESHVREAEDFPDIQARLQEHLAETRLHAARVQECLALLGEKPSTAKSIIGNITGMVQGASTGMFRDAIVKNLLSDYAAENFEIACYQSLVTAAEELGQTQIAEMCQEILNDEEAMAGWIESHIPEVTRAFMQRQTATA